MTRTKKYIHSFSRVRSNSCCHRRVVFLLLSFRFVSFCEMSKISMSIRPTSRFFLCIYIDGRVNIKLIDDIHRRKPPPTSSRWVDVCSDFNYRSSVLKRQPCSWCVTIWEERRRRQQQQQQQHHHHHCEDNSKFFSVSFLSISSSYHYHHYIRQNNVWRKSIFPLLVSIIITRLTSYEGTA